MRCMVIFQYTGLLRNRSRLKGMSYASTTHYSLCYLRGAASSSRILDTTPKKTSTTLFALPSSQQRTQVPLQRLVWKESTLRSTTLM